MSDEGNKNSLKIGNYICDENHPACIIHTPYQTLEGIAIQSKFDQRGIGQVKPYPKYRKGLKDIKGFSHLILIYHFHREKREKIIVKP